MNANSGPSSTARRLSTQLLPAKRSAVASTCRTRFHIQRSIEHEPRRQHERYERGERADRQRRWANACGSPTTISAASATAAASSSGKRQVLQIGAAGDRVDRRAGPASNANHSRDAVAHDFAAGQGLRHDAADADRLGDRTAHRERQSSMFPIHAGWSLRDDAQQPTGDDGERDRVQLFRLDVGAPEQRDVDVIGNVDRDPFDRCVVGRFERGLHRDHGEAGSVGGRHCSSSPHDSRRALGDLQILRSPRERVRAREPLARNGDREIGDHAHRECGDEDRAEAHEGTPRCRGTRSLA